MFYLPFISYRKMSHNPWTLEPFNGDLPKDEPEYLESLRLVLDLHQEWWGLAVEGTKLDGKGKKGEE